MQKEKATRKGVFHYVTSLQKATTEMRLYLVDLRADTSRNYQEFSVPCDGTVARRAGAASCEREGIAAFVGTPQGFKLGSRNPTRRKKRRKQALPFGSSDRSVLACRAADTERNPTARPRLLPNGERKVPRATNPGFGKKNQINKPNQVQLY